MVDIFCFFDKALMSMLHYGKFAVSPSELRVDQYIAEDAPQLNSQSGQRPRILVLKVGTSTIMNEGQSSFSLGNLGAFVDTVCDLKDKGYHVSGSNCIRRLFSRNQIVMISSGAVGSGCVHMHMDKRPQMMVETQALSAIGQCRLMRLWEDIFAMREKKVAQLLVTR